MRPIIIGFPIDLLLAWILAHMLSSFIFQVNANDLLVWGASCLYLTFITIIAAIIPVLHVINADPIKALRNE
jgi:ABC-type antimicrobial peptide transport system permease subunit